MEINDGKLFTGSDQNYGSVLYMTAKAVNGHSKGSENWAYQHDTADSDSDTGSHCNDAITGQPPHADEEKGMLCESGTHSIILDISTTNFVDMVTVKTLKNVSVPGPASLKHRLIQNNVNKAQLLLISYYESLLWVIMNHSINNSGKKLQLCFILSDIQRLWTGWFGHLSSRLPRWVAHDTKQRQTLMSLMHSRTVIAHGPGLSGPQSFPTRLSSQANTSITMNSLGSFFFFGHLSACVVEQLETAGFFPEIPKSKLFVTVHDAVLHILHKLGHAEYFFVSTSVILISKFRFLLLLWLVIAIKSPLLIAGYQLQHSNVASRGQAAIFFILQL